MRKNIFFIMLGVFTLFDISAFSMGLSAPEPVSRKDYVNRHTVHRPTDPRVLYLKQKQQLCLIPGSCEPKKEESVSKYENRFREQSAQQRLIQSLRKR